MSKFADEVHLSFEASTRYFGKRKNIFVTGNPVRRFKLISKAEAKKFFGLDENKKTLLVFGGSSGARSINKAMLKSIKKLVESGVQIIWQVGKLDFDEVKFKLNEILNKDEKKFVKIFKFIDKMELAYSACELAVCRAGAVTIAEITNYGVPAVLVPYPKSAGGHQLENAKLLYENNAGEILLDSEVEAKLCDKVIELIFDEKKLETIRENAKKLA